MMDDEFGVCICGGGNIGHSLAAAFGRYGDVCVLTRRPKEWASRLKYQIAGQPWVETKGCIVASDDAAMAGKAAVVIIALPRFAIETELCSIETHLRNGQALVFVPAPSGLERIEERLRSKGVEIVGFQRVPFISRTRDYGKSVNMGVVRQVSRLAVSNRERRRFWAEYFKKHIGGDMEFLSSFLSFTLSNSNPLLHPARLIELLQKESYDDCPLFYSEWGDTASELYVAADGEMRQVFEASDPVSAKLDYESVLDHYGVKTTRALTEKIRSIEAFKEITAPYLRRCDGLWYPDFNSRYFTEDVPFGTQKILDLASSVRVQTPTIKFLVSEVNRFVSGGQR